MNIKYVLTGNRDEAPWEMSSDKLGASNSYYKIQVFALLFVSNVTSSRISVENVTSENMILISPLCSTALQLRPVLQWPVSAGHHCTQPA